MTPPINIEQIGVFGGTFDPIHNGHLAIAESVRLQLGLDKVIFVVAADQWLRQHPPEASATDRFNMVELAVGRVPYFSASDVDLVRQGHTYTIDTLRDLRTQLGDSVALKLIIGADAANSFHRWKHAEKIQSFATVVVVGRPTMKIKTPLLGGDLNTDIEVKYLEGPMVNVSATMIRNLNKSEKQIEEFTPQAVIDYIKSKRLYRK
jgi:nicotinate-nucleotide adenylyltransferase